MAEEIHAILMVAGLAGGNVNENVATVGISVVNCVVLGKKNQKYLLKNRRLHWGKNI